MTIEEKSKELIDKFSRISEWNPGEGGYVSLGINAGKQCAIICVEQIINAIPMYTGSLNPDWKYWQEVLDILKAS